VIKDNSLKTGKTPCTRCGRPSTCIQNNQPTCDTHTLAKGEKRAGADASFKDAIDLLTDVHLPGN
jgi:hypothetical protein